MPRDGSGVYSTPPGTLAITNTPVPSTPYNTNVADVAQDLNVPRPIVAGGTGATNAKDAMTALGGEIANQVVTNFDSDPLVAGSFYADPGATSAPVAGHYFIGIVYTHDSGLMTIEARDPSDGNTPHIKYVRTKNLNTWGPWAREDALMNTAKVDRAGDTMTGPLVLTGSTTPQLQFNPTSGATKTGQVYQQGDVVDIGAVGQPTPLQIDLNNGNVTANGSVTASGTISSTGTAAALSLAARSGGPTMLLHNNTGQYNFFDVTNGINCAGLDKSGMTVAGVVTVNGNLYANSGVMQVTGSTTPQIQFVTSSGSTKQGQIYQQGDYLNLGTVGVGIRLQVDMNSGNTSISSPTTASSPTAGALTVVGGVGIGQGLVVNNGGRFQGGFAISGAGIGVELFTGGGTGYVQSWDRTAGTVAPLSVSASTFAVNCGMTVAGDVHASRSNAANIGVYYFGTGGNTYIYNDGTTFSINGGDVAASGGFNVGLNLLVAGQGYKPGGGAWADSSDARIKNVLGDYENGLDQILALTPKRFTYKGNDTKDAPSNSALMGPDQPVDKSEPTVPYKNSGHYAAAAATTEFVGLVAQDAEGPMPELVSLHGGYIDGIKTPDIRVIDPTPLIYALVNAVKQLATRVEELEASR